MFSGKLTKPEDFIVREVIDERLARKFIRTENGIEKMSGRYSLYLMKKRNWNTRDAIKFISNKLKIPASFVGYAGLKDKNAVTYQHITIKDGPEKSFIFKDISLIFQKKVNRMLSPGDLRGNNFEITLHGCRNTEELEKIIPCIEKGFANFFGRQRFGLGKNHLTGRKIIRQKEIPGGISKEQAKFYIHAYQSWIFNKALELCIKNKKIPEYLPLIGFGAESVYSMGDILKKEKILPEDFKIDKLKIMCRGGQRKTVVKTKINCSIDRQKVLLKFSLPKGSYATVLLNAIGKVSMHFQQKK